MLLCQEMSQMMPTPLHVIARTQHQMYQGTPVVAGRCIAGLSPALKMAQPGVEHAFDAEQLLVSGLEARVDDLLQRGETRVDVGPQIGEPRIVDATADQDSQRRHTDGQDCLRRLIDHFLLQYTLTISMATRIFKTKSIDS